MIAKIILYLLLPAAQVALFVSGRPVTDVWELLNYCASIFTFHWLCLNVLFCAKIPALQRMLPYDGRVRFHIFTSAGIAAFVAYHAAYKITSGRLIDPQTLLLSLSLTALLVFAVLWMPVPGFRAFRRNVVGRFRRLPFFSYDKSKARHGLLVFILAPLMFIHISGAGMFSLSIAISSVLYFILFVFSIGAYILSRAGAFRVKATVIEAVKEDGTIRLKVKPAGRHRYRNGQFAFIRYGKETHPFSYVSSPDEEVVEFGIREVGDFTQTLGELKPGSVVSLDGGYGDFVPRKESAVCLISSGIGSAPCVSIVKGFRLANDARDVQFHASVIDEAEIPSRESLARIAEEMPGFRMNVTNRSFEDEAYSGEYFRTHIQDPLSFTYYICGPRTMRASVIKALRNLGVKKTAIRYETFAMG